MSLCACLWASTASAYVYFAGSATNSIGRVANDGTHLEPSFITGASKPEGLAITGSYIYWANSASGSIGRARIDGSEVEQNLITGAQEPFSVAVDSSKVAWTDKRGDVVGWANLDGSGAQNVLSFSPEVGKPYGIALDDTYVYISLPEAFPGGGFISRAPISNPTVATKIVNPRGGSGRPEGLFVDGTHIYWAEVISPITGYSVIGRANLDGTEENDQLIGEPIAKQLAVFGGYVYWSYSTSYNPQSFIGRATATNSEFNREWVKVGDNAAGLAVDGLAPPPSGGSGGSSSLGGGAGATTPSGAPSAGVLGALVRAALTPNRLRPTGKGAKISAILKHGYVLTFQAPTAGTAVIGWYMVPHGARLSKTHPRPVLVAQGRRSFSSAGGAKIRILLTSAGRRMLQHAHQITLTAKGIFTPVGSATVTETARFSLHV